MGDEEREEKGYMESAGERIALWVSMSNEVDRLDD